MTAVLTPPNAEATPAPVWREVAPGMWTSTTNGEIAGSVEHMGTFITTNARGDVVGTFGTINEARAALTSPPAPTRQPRRPSKRSIFFRAGRK